MAKKTGKENKDNDVPVVHTGRVISVPITKEMKDSYISYAMSVITSRALPDVRDGLKPVHGDTSVYDAMVQMAQDFSTRYPLVIGQGNFGTIDGDNAAAMRYTEAKMSKIAGEMMRDLEKETVDWRGNYDQTRKEPSVLPAALPNLLLN